jgi:hypothetical protein
MRVTARRGDLTASSRISAAASFAPRFKPDQKKYELHHILRLFTVIKNSPAITFFCQHVKEIPAILVYRRQREWRSREKLCFGA